MEIFNLCNDFYNDILNAINKLNNNDKLSSYDIFLLDNISTFAFSFRSIRNALENFNKRNEEK